MAHTAEETLTEAQKVYDGQEGRQNAHEVSPTHPGEDLEWWVTNEEHETFAVGTWADEGGTEINFRNYKP